MSFIMIPKDIIGIIIDNGEFSLETSENPQPEGEVMWNTISVLDSGAVGEFGVVSNFTIVLKTRTIIGYEISPNLLRENHLKSLRELLVGMRKVTRRKSQITQGMIFNTFDDESINQWKTILTLNLSSDRMTY